MYLSFFFYFHDLTKEVFNTETDPVSIYNSTNRWCVPELSYRIKENLFKSHTNEDRFKLS